MKNTVITLKNMKADGEKITMITAYDYSIASIVDRMDINVILVGDSLGMVCLGYSDTLAVTVEDMIHHIKAVSRGTKNAMLVGDMPFMSYQVSCSEAVRNAGRLVKEGGAMAIKLEGGVEYIDEIRAIIRAQIPVMGHLGLTPQSINLFGGYKVQGKEIETAQKLINDAKCLEEAGVFAIVLECIPANLAKIITQSISIPTIGIGAGVHCDGQVLVVNDILNINAGDKKKFVKIFGEAGYVIEEGIKNYCMEVRAGSFPADVNSFTVCDEVVEKLY